MSEPPPWDTWGQPQRQPSFSPHPQPYGQPPYPQQGPPPPYQEPYPPQSGMPDGQQPYPPQSARPPRRPRTRGRRNRNVVCLLVIVVAVIFVVANLTSGGSGAKYSAHVISYTVINPADLSVAVRVANTGTKPGTPTCTIDAEDPSYTYTGVDVATLQGAVGPGTSTTFVDNLTITKQGATYVTQVTVSC